MKNKYAVLLAVLFFLFPIADKANGILFTCDRVMWDNPPGRFAIERLDQSLKTPDFPFPLEERAFTAHSLRHDVTDEECEESLGLSTPSFSDFSRLDRIRIITNWIFQSLFISFSSYWLFRTLQQKRKLPESWQQLSATSFLMIAIPITLILVVFF